jgi:hypothetical protein
VAIVGFGVWIILALMGKIQSHEKKVASSSKLAL